MPGKETDPEAAKFKDYFEWSEPLAKAPSHRVLAMRRGEKELFLMMRVQLPDETAAFADRASRSFVNRRNRGPAAARPSRARRAGRLQAPARARDGNRDAARVEEARRRSRDQGLRRQPPRAAARRAARPEAPCWRSTPASAPAARPSCSIARASCCTTTSSIPDRAARRKRRRSSSAS